MTFVHRENMINELKQNGSWKAMQILNAGLKNLFCLNILTRNLKKCDADEEM